MPKLTAMSALCLGLLLTGCGLKSDLYLPDENAQDGSRQTTFLLFGSGQDDDSDSEED